MSERSAVQSPLIRYAQAIGWVYVTPERALELRGGEAGLFFGEILAAQLQKLNPGVVDDGRAADILRRLLHLAHGQPGLRRERLAQGHLDRERTACIPG